MIIVIPWPSETALSRQAENKSTVKPVLSGHSKIDKIKVLQTDGSLMQV